MPTTTNNQEVDSSSVDLSEYYRTTPDINLSTVIKNEAPKVENLHDTVENNTAVNPFAKKKMSKFLKREENLSSEPTISKFFSNKNCTEGDKNDLERLSDAENGLEEQDTNITSTEASLNISNEVMEDDYDSPYYGELPLETVLVEEQSVLDIKLHALEMETVQYFQNFVLCDSYFNFVFRLLAINGNAHLKLITQNRKQEKS